MITKNIPIKGSVADAKRSNSPQRGKGDAVPMMVIKRKISVNKLLSKIAMITSKFLRI